MTDLTIAEVEINNRLIYGTGPVYDSHIARSIWWAVAKDNVENPTQNNKKAFLQIRKFLDPNLICILCPLQFIWCPTADPTLLYLGSLRSNRGCARKPLRQRFFLIGILSNLPSCCWPSLPQEALACNLTHPTCPRRFLRAFPLLPLPLLSLAPPLHSLLAYKHHTCRARRLPPFDVHLGRNRQRSTPVALRSPSDSCIWWFWCSPRAVPSPWDSWKWRVLGLGVGSPSPGCSSLPLRLIINHWMIAEQKSTFLGYPASGLSASGRSFRRTIRDVRAWPANEGCPLFYLFPLFAASGWMEGWCDVSVRACPERRGTVGDTS